MEILQKEYFNNSLLSYLIATGLFATLVLVLRAFRYIVLKRLRRWAQTTHTNLDDFIVHAIERAVLPLLHFAALYIALNSLDLSVKVHKLLHGVSVVVITFFMLRLLSTAIKHAIIQRLKKIDETGSKVMQIKGIMIIVQIIIWVLGIIFLLDNFGYDITAFVTGLGIGGIAIALAAQNILGDLFNYFVIFFDRPFEVGDFIVVDDKRGTVEAIGIKTSRIRSLTGEELVFANSDVSNARIHNYKRLQRRRIVFQIGVTYQTSLEHLKEIPVIMQGILTEIDDADLDRVHFLAFGDFSLNFETVYFVNSTEYLKYMDIQQKINLKLYEEFEKRGIEFAYPTQTLYLSRQANNTGT